MEYPTDTRLSELVASCRRRSNHELAEAYMLYLGLPLAKLRATGRVKFNDRTGHVKAFYKQTCDMANTVFHMFDTEKEFRRNVLDPRLALAEKVTKSLSIYGPIIWNPSDRSLTRINEVYKRELDYHDVEDRKRIKACVYYWIIQRAMRKFSSLTHCTRRRTSKSSKRNAARNTASDPIILDCPIEDSEFDSSGEYREQNTLQFDTDQATLRNPGVLSPQRTLSSDVTTSTRGQALVTLVAASPLHFLATSRLSSIDTLISPNSCITEQEKSELPSQVLAREHTYGNPILTQQVPVILEVAGTSRSAAMSRLSSVDALTNVDPRSLELGELRKPLEVVNETNKNFTMSADTSQTRTVRRGNPANSESSSIGSLSLRKRQVPLAAGEHDITIRPRKRRKQILDIEIDQTTSRVDTVYLSSSGSLNLEDLRKGVAYAIHDRPVIPRETSPDELAPEWLSGLQVAASVSLNTHEDDEYSVLSSEKELQAILQAGTKLMLQGKDPSTATKTSLTCLDDQSARPATIPAHNHTKPLQVDHSHLRARLLRLLETCNPGTQEVTAIEEVVRLIKRVRRDRAPTSDNASAIEHTVLTQWLQCIEGLTWFRRATGFGGDRIARDAFVLALPRSMRKSLRVPWNEAMSVVSEWRHSKDFDLTRFSNVLASLFFDITSWDVFTSQSDLEELSLEFNENMMAWYGF